MPELWPPSLPIAMNVSGHSYSFGDPSIRSAPSVGPSKVRPRSSAVSSPLSGVMYLSTAQLNTLRDFYKITVRGSDVFLFPDQEALTPGAPLSPMPMVNCRFTSSPSVAATAAVGMWAVSLPLEIIP